MTSQIKQPIKNRVIASECIIVIDSQTATVWEEYFTQAIFTHGKRFYCRWHPPFSHKHLVRNDLCHTLHHHKRLLWRWSWDWVSDGGGWHLQPGDITRYLCSGAAAQCRVSQLAATRIQYTSPAGCVLHQPEACIRLNTPLLQTLHHKPDRFNCQGSSTFYTGYLVVNYPSVDRFI